MSWRGGPGGATPWLALSASLNARYACATLGNSSGADREAEEEEEAPERREAEVIDLLSDEEEEAKVQEDDGSQPSDEEDDAGPAPVYDDEEAEGSEVASEDEGEARAHLVDVEEDGEASEAGSSDEEDDDERQSSPALGPATAHDVTEILDSDEEPEEQPVPVSDRRAIPARFLRKPDVAAPARMVNSDDEGVDEDEEQGEKEAERKSGQ